MKKNLLFCFLTFCVIYAHAQVSQGSALTQVVQPGTPQYPNNGQLIPNPAAKPMNGNSALGVSYTQSKCGLNYVTASQRLGQRFSPAGVAQPAAFVISGIPAGATIEKAFLWAGGSGTGAAQTANINGPGGAAGYPMAMIGSGPDVCWSYSGTYAYRGDLTPSVNGNGTYNISGINVYGSPTTSDDMSGATLMVIYSDPSASWTGNINISDGNIVVAGGNASYSQPLTAICGTPSNGRAFAFIDDLQSSGFALTMNGTAALGTWNWWNYFDVGTTYTTGQTSSSLLMVQPSDCYAVMGYGTYYQNTNCISCASFSVTATATAAICSACNGAATASVSPVGSYTYTWAPSGGNAATATGLCAGNYTVSVSSGTITKTQTVSVTSTSVTPAVSIAQASVACYGGCTGASTLTPSGGTAPYSYTWSPSGGSGATAGSLCAGNYSVNVRDANGCAITKTFSITQPSSLTVVATQTNVLCNGGTSGVASVSVSGGTGAYTYSWSPSGGSGPTATGLATGAYTCTIKDANNCSVTQTFSISQPAALASVGSQTNVLCYGGSTGAAGVSTSGGMGAFTYSWTPSGGSGSTATGLSTGSYTCTVKDGNNCSTSTTFSITQPSSVTVVATQTNVACNSGSTGIAAVSASGGTGAYTYTWSPSGGNAATATGLAAGNYTCTIKDANLCSTTVTVNITQPAAVTAVSAYTNVLCYGGTTGQASYTVSGGTPGYTYSWTPSGGSGASASGLAAGNYTFTAKDTKNCSYTNTFTVTQPSSLTVVATQTNVLCNGGTSGVAKVSVSGGTGAYTYSWSPSGGSGVTATGLATGAYTCTIKDANNCSVTQTFSISQPAALTVVATQTNVLCNGGTSGVASVSVSGGTGAYTYSWTPSGGSGATATGLSTGAYTCTVKDANNCSTSSTFSITQPPSITAVSSLTNVTCYGASTGAAGYTVSGGTPGYTYSWTPSGGSGASATGLAAGNYTFTAKDVNNCIYTNTFTVTQPASLTVVATQTNVLCNGGTSGVANVSVSGGTGAYTYSWVPSGGSGTTATGLSTGTYTCTIKDANNCSTTHTFNISQPTALTSVGSQTNVLCNGGTSGAASVAVSGGTGAYTYSWTPSGGSGATATGLSTGSYTCTIKDANNCNTSTSFSITQPSTITVVTTQTNVACNAGNTGIATVSVSGGTGSYTYTWSPSGGSAATASGLAAGNYTCTMKDANLCTSTATFNIAQPTAITAVSAYTNVACSGGTTGQASYTVSGGTPGYTYSWTPSGGSGASASGFAAGSYTFTAKDANNCTYTNTFAITQPSSVTATFTQTNVLCFGQSNGAASVTAAGGTPGYTYTWSPSGGNGVTATSLPAGNYSCSITDANSCVLVSTVTITEPAALSSVQSQTNVACSGGNTGAASVTVSGGTASYTYSWSPTAGSSAGITGLSAGNYTCIIHDVHNCALTNTFTILQQSSLNSVTTTTNVLCNGGNNGAANVSVSGGAPGYTYTWSPSGGNSALAGALSAGVYTCTISDANNCTDTKTVTITEPPALSSVLSQTNVTCYGTNTGIASYAVSGGTPGYTYSWTPSGGSGTSASGLAAGNYTFTAKDINNCVYTSSLTITQPASLTVAATQTNVLCNGGTSGAASVSVSGGTGAYTYTWSPSGGSGATATGLSTGSYTCNISDANNCSLTQTFSISEPAVLVSVGSQTNALCYGSSTGAASVSVSGGTGAYTYSWSPAAGASAGITGLPMGSYTCTIKDANNCSINTTFSITQPSSITVVATQTNVSCNAGSTGIAAVSASGGTGSYTYTWSPAGGNAATATGLAAGNYTCSIQDANFCTATATVVITEPMAVSAVMSYTDVLCFGQSNGAANASVAGGTGAYSYTWAASGGNAATASGLIAGTYSCTIADANNCVLVSTVTVSQPTALSSVQSQTDVACNGGNNGQAAVSVSGGTGAYTYSWSPVSSSSGSASSLTAGNYTCVIHDANNCVLTNTFAIVEQSALLSVISGTNVSCNGGSDGSVSMTVTGGTPGYTYTWSPTGGNASSGSGLPAGTYVCTIEDLNHCTDSKTVTVTEPSSLSATHTQTNVSCSGFSNGQIIINATGATPAYSYSWTPAVSSGSVASGLAAGNYTCVVKDANGCSFTHTVGVRQPSALVASSSFTDVSCNGANNGSAAVNASGGSPAYSYTWTSGAGSNASATSLSPGNYTCTIADINNCTITQTFAIAQPQQITASLSQSPSDCGGSTGSATIAVSGGITPYTYTWSAMVGNNATVSNIPTGTYTCTVMDNNLCTASFTTAVGVINPTVTAITSQQSVCPAQTATFTASGGSTYTWSPATGLTAPTNSVTSASPPSTTTYTVTGANVYGCTSTATLQLAVYASPVIIATASQPTICSQSSSTLSASGASTYTWSPAAGLSGTSGNTTVATLTAGSTYTVDAIDSHGCAGSQTVQVSVNPLPVIVASPASSSICAGGSTTLNASGAVTYTWSNGTVSSSNLVSPTSATVYTVTGTDVNGCISYTTAAVGVNPLPVISVNGVTVICQGQSSTISAGGANTYTWSTGQNGTIINPSPGSTTTYSVTGEDNNGCKNTSGITVTVLITPTLSITGNNEICLGDNAVLTANGGTSYQWSGGEQTAQVTLSPGASSVYTVTSGVSPCASSATFAVTVYTPAPVVAAPSATLINYGQSTPIGASSNATIYQWTPSTWLSCSNCANPVATPDKTTEYIVTTTDDHGCKSSDTVLVEVDLTCGEVFVPESFSPNSDGHNDTWCVYGNCIQELNVELYDRWGQKVFEGFDKTSCWDGRIMGEMQNSNVYMFQVRAVLVNGEKVFKKGNVTLVR